MNARPSDVNIPRVAPAPGWLGIRWCANQLAFGKKKKEAKTMRSGGDTSSPASSTGAELELIWTHVRKTAVVC